jgi:hypothetical protein
MGQTSRWLKYANTWAPIHRQEEVNELYRDAYQSTLDSLDVDEFDYLALGCGDGLKDASFLGLAVKAKKRPKVTLVDVSPSLLLSAVQRLDIAQARLVVADLESRPKLSELCKTRSEHPLVFSCFGMLPTLGHDILLPYLASILRPKDRLILSANLSPTESKEDKAEILKQYDNPEARQWYTGALLELGLERTDFELQCCVEPLDNIAGAYRIITFAELLLDLTIRIFGETCPMKAGDRIVVFRSDRWTPQALHHRINILGMDVTHLRESEDCQEGVYLMTKRNQFS